MPIYKEIITDVEIAMCPISESIKVLTLFEALQILKMDVKAMDASFLTGLHQELIHHMIQRGTMAEHVLISPNICAELFTIEQIRDNEHYVINKLLGRRDSEGHRNEDFDTLSRQTFRKILKLIDDLNDDYLTFFWAKEPNLIYRVNSEWRFHPKSPAYKALVDFYGRWKPVD